MPPVVDDPGGVVTGLDWRRVIADRGSTRRKTKVVLNVEAETRRRRPGHEYEWSGAVMIENYDSVDVFVGVDVGTGEHHAVALNRAGQVLFDKALPNDEGKMRAVLQKLK